MKPDTVTPTLCQRCGARVFYALVIGDIEPPLDVMLDADPVADPVADGPLWVDGHGWARDVRHLYRDGEPRYRPHTLTCRGLDRGVARASEDEKDWLERGTGGAGR